MLVSCLKGKVQGLPDSWRGCNGEQVVLSLFSACHLEDAADTATCIQQPSVAVWVPVLLQACRSADHSTRLLLTSSPALRPNQPSIITVPALHCLQQLAMLVAAALLLPPGDAHSLPAVLFFAQARCRHGQHTWEDHFAQQSSQLRSTASQQTPRQAAALVAMVCAAAVRCSCGCADVRSDLTCGR